MMNPTRRHRPDIRSLAGRTYAAAWKGHDITPELYSDLYPDDSSVGAGMESSLEVLSCLHEGSDNIQQLTSMLRAAHDQTRTPMALLAGISSAAYILGANDVLGGERDFPDPDDLTPAAFAKRGRNGYFPEEGLTGQDILHPSAYYQTINGLSELHAIYETIESTMRPTPPLKDACEVFGWQFGSKVVSDLLHQLRQSYGSTGAEKWLAEAVKLPYKYRLFDGGLRAKDFSVQHEAAALAIRGLRDATCQEPREPMFNRAGNYEPTLRAVCASYHALRKQGLSREDSVRALYANSGRFTVLTRGGD